MACLLLLNEIKEVNRLSLTDVTADTFDKEVFQADKPVLVDFWGPRCAPCLRLMPAVESLAEEHADHLKVVKVNASIRPNWRLCGDHKIVGLPAYLFFQDGKEVKRITGKGITRETLAEAIDEIVNGS